LTACPERNRDPPCCRNVKTAKSAAFEAPAKGHTGRPLNGLNANPVDLS
jgi:hypothetical protein